MDGTEAPDVAPIVASYLVRVTVRSNHPGEVAPTNAEVERVVEAAIQNETALAALSSIVMVTARAERVDK